MWHVVTCFSVSSTLSGHPSSSVPFICIHFPSFSFPIPVMFIPMQCATYVLSSSFLKL